MTDAATTEQVDVRGVDVRGLSYSHRGSARALHEIDVVARPGDLVAVVGASGAGKSTLLLCLAGLLTATAGLGTVAGVPVSAPAHRRAGRVGYVPQDDALHTELSVRRELTTAAEIRGFTGADATRRVRGVLHALGLETMGERPIGQLSGGERKRVSVAVELLSTPEVLLLDEATSGLDPMHERDLIDYLRRLARAGCTVVFTTHSVAHLDEVDALLLLGTGGRPLWFGSPAAALATAAVSSYVDLFAVTEPLPRPDREPADEPPAITPDRVRHTPGRTSRLGALLRRDGLRLVADRRTLAVVLLQAPVLGLLVRAMTGDAGLALGAFAPNLEARRVLLTLVLCASWLGSTNSVRDIVRDRSVSRRERVAGIRGGDVVVTKLVTAWLLCLGQVVVLAAVGIGGTSTYGRAPVVGVPFVGVVLTLWLCAGAAASIALAISAFARSTDQALAILPLILVPQLILSGGVIAVGDNAVLRPLAAVSAARWGLSGVASAAHLRAVETDSVIPHPVQQYERNLARHEDADASWHPTATAWTGDVLALLLIAAAGAGAAGIGVRRT